MRIVLGIVGILTFDLFSQTLLHERFSQFGNFFEETLFERDFFDPTFGRIPSLRVVARGGRLVSTSSCFRPC
jgi:hypothetical protein